MKKLVLIIKCRRCGHEIHKDAADVDQEALNSEEGWDHGRLPIGVVYPAAHECHRGNYGMYRYVGYDIVEVEDGE